MASFLERMLVKSGYVPDTVSDVLGVTLTEKYPKSPFKCLTRIDCGLHDSPWFPKGVVYPRIGRLETEEDFFRFQHETSTTIAKIKDEAIKKYREELFTEGFNELEDSMFHLSDKRRDKVMLRGVHSRIYTLALGGRDDRFTSRVGASIEFLLEDMYYLNQIFDSKAGADSAQNMIASVQTNDLLWQLLIPSKVKSFEQKQKVFTALNEDVNKVISSFYYGEYIDCNWNIWGKMKRELIMLMLYFFRQLLAWLQKLLTYIRVKKFQKEN